MPGPMDIIRDYLVALGFQVNTAEYAKMQQFLKQVDRLVSGHTETMAASYVKASGIIVSALGSITASTAAMVDKIAQADLNWQKFALRMYLTQDTARRLKITTDALGESLEDIAWIPELRNRYISLMNQSQLIESGMPGDMGDMLVRMRDIRFEFTRMKVEAIYSMMYISYYLSQLLGKPVKGLHDGLKNINDWITRNMPTWTQKVADFLSMIIQLAGSAARPIKDLAEIFGKLWEGMSKEEKIAAAIAGIGALFMLLGPTGKWFMALSGFVLLIDDFYAYIDGRKSSKTLAPIWYTLIAVVEKITKAVWLAVQGVSWLMGNKPPDSKGFIADLQSLWNAAGEGPRTEAGPGPGEGPKAKAGPNTGKRWSSINDIYSQAQKVSQKTGLPTSWIFGQWYHETGGFTNRGATQLNNLAGLKGRNGQYLSFGSIGEFSDYFASYLKRKQAGSLDAKTPEDYAAALKRGGYYEDAFSNYAAGIKRGISAYQGFFGSSQITASGGGVNQVVSVGDVNINIPQPGATPQEIYSETIKGMKDALGKATVRNLRDFQGVYQ